MGIFKAFQGLETVVVVTLCVVVLWFLWRLVYNEVIIPQIGSNPPPAPWPLSCLAEVPFAFDGQTRLWEVIDENIWAFQEFGGSTQFIFVAENLDSDKPRPDSRSDLRVLSRAKSSIFILSPVLQYFSLPDSWMRSIIAFLASGPRRCSSQ